MIVFAAAKHVLRVNANLLSRKDIPRNLRWIIYSKSVKYDAM